MKTPEMDLYERLSGLSEKKPTAPSEGSTVERAMAAADPEFGTPVTLRNLFTHQDTHPVVLDFALLKALGPEWVGWEAETIWAEIQRVFQSQVSETTRAKILALQTLHVSMQPWQVWQVFEKMVQALNGVIPRWQVMQAPSLEQLYAYVDMLDYINTAEFSDEVKLYAAAAVLHEDVTYVPPPLDFIQLEVSQPVYHCRDCGNEDSALFHDGICDTCSQKFDADQGLSMRPKLELVQKGKGLNIEMRLKYDPALVQKRWGEVEHLALEKVDLAETPADIQVAKLLVARDYMNIRRRQLVEQMTTLRPWLGAAT